MKDSSFLKPAIIGLAIVLTALILGKSFKNRNAAQDSISVTGLGSVDFTSDEISWSGSFSTKATEAKDAYNLISADKEKVKTFFISKGFKENEFSFGGVNFDKAYRTITLESENNVTKTEQVFDGYTATQTVNFVGIKNPALMKKIEDVIDHTAELINSGIEFNSNAVQYTYSDLPSLKHNLIEKASQDAKERAQKIVRTADGRLGKLKDASMGVFQITGKGSVEEDSYGGNNDTYSKAKTARITVRLTYELD
ncbi:SIMPL domain-containing protein [Ferruginibacter albus]|uniref:SIMPL domain-containing protein n=1 Tax=Ferruginibacter albus TaxID=2875540 RepID=UPI001CC6EA5D|nr:SIMPL domain-containing protein [Ferruginibacter albus]UAY53534.1 SIMPL domain-containing protein [Ferruginibacter albus]